MIGKKDGVIHMHVYIFMVIGLLLIIIFVETFKKKRSILEMRAAITVARNF